MNKLAETKPTVNHIGALVAVGTLLLPCFGIAGINQLGTLQAFAEDEEIATSTNPSLFAEIGSMRSYLIDEDMVRLRAQGLPPDQEASRRLSLTNEYAAKTDVEIITEFCDFIWNNIDENCRQILEQGGLEQAKKDKIVNAQSKAQAAFQNFKTVLVASAGAGTLSSSETLAAASEYSPAIRELIDELDIGNVLIINETSPLRYSDLFVTPPKTHTPYAGINTGRGISDMTVRSLSNGEYGGTEEKPYIDENGNPTDDPGTPDNPNDDNPLYNPDENGDNLGDNLAFTVPISINFAMKADGVLLGPNNAYIENKSVFPIHTSSLLVDRVNEWNIVENAAEAEEDNSISVALGPQRAPQSMAKFVGTKRSVSGISDGYWDMEATDSTDGSGRDALGISLSGNASHVTKDITEKETFGRIHWYMSSGFGQ